MKWNASLTPLKIYQFQSISYQQQNWSVLKSVTADCSMVLQTILFASNITIDRRVSLQQTVIKLYCVCLVATYIYNNRMQRSEDQRRIMLFAVKTCYDPFTFSFTTTIYGSIELANMYIAFHWKCMNFWSSRYIEPLNLLNSRKKETIHKPFERICNNS